MSTILIKSLNDQHILDMCDKLFCLLIDEETSVHELKHLTLAFLDYINVNLNQLTEIKNVEVEYPIAYEVATKLDAITSTFR